MSNPDRVSLRGFMGRYYAYVFLFDFMLVYAVYTALFQLQGLSVTEIGVLLAFWSATAIVFEMPSGALSDHFDRRWLLVAAPLFKAVTFVLWAVAAGNFWVYGAGFLFWSVAQALQSGSREALLYETYDRAGRSDEFERVLGRDNAAEGLGIGAGTLFGGFVAVYGFDWVIWLSVPPLLVASALAFGLPDPRRRTTQGIQQAGGARNYLGHFSDAVSEFRRSAEIRRVTVYVAVGLVVFELLEEFDQLYYLAITLPVWAWGIAGAGIEAVHAGASLSAHRLSGRPWLAWALPLAGGVLLALASIGDSPWYVLLLCAAYVVIAPVSVLSEARFHRVIEGTSRATTTSALVMSENIVGIVLTLGFGLFADMIGILPAYGWAGASMLPFAAWIWWQQRQGARFIA